MSDKSPSGSSDDLGVVTHELQAPLTILRTRLEAVLSRSWCTGECREMVRECLEEVQSLNQMVVDLVLLGQVKSGRLPAGRERLDLAQLAESVGSRFAPVADSRGLRLQLRVEGPLPVRGDPSQIRRILVNLMDNAFKYTPTGGEVGLEAKRGPATAELKVFDTGVGIPPDAIPRIFEPFFRVGGGAGREAVGFGLGLSIARALSIQNGGTLEVESRSDRGSCFTLRLPLAGG